jgi:two-component system, cell cycle response regulator DivK
MLSVQASRQTDPLLALLADRDADTRKLYAGYLRLGTWNVDEAADGPEALAKAIGKRPSIIVTETRLPGISGYDLCGILKRDPITQTIPIVVVTSDAFPADLHRAKASGADAILIKPCLPETLLAEVRRVIGESHRLRERSADALDRIAALSARSEVLLERSEAQRRRMLSHAHHRHDTTTPPVTPPELICPDCDAPLVYQRSHIGGVSERHPEQWDYYECSAECGTFQYRERTRKLRRVP